MYLSVCFCAVGIMAGAPCPSEIIRKLKTNMNIKEITVSAYMYHAFSNNAVVKPIYIPVNENNII